MTTETAATEAVVTGATKCASAACGPMRRKVQDTPSLSKERGEAMRAWHIVDANGVPVGRLASQVAHIIRGKHKVVYTPHVDGGDFVIVVNAAKARFTGRKLDQKFYHSYSGYVGGDKSRLARDVMNKYPERIIEAAVQGMLPRGPLGRRMLLKLKVYPGAEHPHVAQQPVAMKVSAA